MADDKLPETLEPGPSKEHSEDKVEEDDEEEEEELQLKKMAELIRHYRTTIPDQLKQVTTSLLEAQRPILSSCSSQISEIGVAGDRTTDAGQNAQSSAEEASLAEEDCGTVDEIRLLTDTISSSLSAMPVILKRVNDCISRIGKRDKYHESIHPAFKRKRV